MVLVKIVIYLCMLPKGFGTFQPIIYHQQIAVHAVSKQRYQGKQIDYQPYDLKGLRHASTEKHIFS